MTIVPFRSPAIVRMGDEYWYGDRVQANLTKAVMNYIWITKDQDSPQVTKLVTFSFFLLQLQLTKFRFAFAKLPV